MSDVTAYVTVENGQVVMHDPVARGMIAAVEEHNRGIAYKDCEKVFELNAEGVERFKNRFAEKGYDPKKCCIVLIHVDDPYGGPISNLLMPNEDWQAIRDRGLMPIARGIADREFIRTAVAEFDTKAASDLDMLSDRIAAVVVFNGVAKVFTV